MSRPSHDSTRKPAPAKAALRMYVEVQRFVFVEQSMSRRAAIIARTKFGLAQLICVRYVFMVSTGLLSAFSVSVFLTCVGGVGQYCPRAVEGYADIYGVGLPMRLVRGIVCIQSFIRGTIMVSR